MGSRVSFSSKFSCPSFSQLINVFPANWDAQLIREILPHNISDAILAISLPNPSHPDCVYWPAAKSKCFTVKSGYGILSNSCLVKTKSSPSSSFVPP